MAAMQNSLQSAKQWEVYSTCS